MKKFFIICLVLLATCSISFAGEGVEKGDVEVGFMAMYYDVGDFEMGNIQLSLGKYITDRLLLGVAPMVAITTDDTDVTGSLNCLYNFTVNSATIPYLKASYYYTEDVEYVQGGFGVKNFFSENAALDTSITYGEPMDSEYEDGMMMVMCGLTFIF